MLVFVYIIHVPIQILIYCFYKIVYVLELSIFSSEDMEVQNNILQHARRVTMVYSATIFVLPVSMVNYALVFVIRCALKKNATMSMDV